MEQKQIGSTIFLGPLGCGKTTLASLMAEYSERMFAQLSAVQDGMPAFKKKIKEAEDSRLLGGMLLFADEIHRWNKSQQDAHCLMWNPVDRIGWGDHRKSFFLKPCASLAMLGDSA